MIVINNWMFLLLLLLLIRVGYFYLVHNPERKKTMAKIQFKLNESLKQCPPIPYYSQLGSDGKPLFPGITYKKRLILNRDLVTFPIKEQIREEDAGEDRVTDIESSYKGKGFLNNKIPQAIRVDPNDPKRFLGAVGFGRNEAQDSLLWESCIYDLIEADTPLNLEKFKLNSNDDADHVPAYENTKATIKKSVINAVVNKLIGDTDDDMYDYLKAIARSKPQWHKSIVDTIRKEDISRWPTMKAFSTKRAKDEAQRLGMPFEGDKNKESKSLGYARKFTTKKNYFWDGMTLSYKYGGKPVNLTTWVDEPNPERIDTQRKEILDNFNEMEPMFNEWVSQYLNMSITEVEEKSKGRFPLKFNGFFAQDTEPKSEKEGLPKESDIVDENGKEWKRLDK